MSRPALVLFTCAAPLCLRLPATAQEPVPLVLSLDAAVSRAVALSEEVGLSRAQQASAEGQIQEVRAGVMPQLTATVNYTRTLASLFQDITFPAPGNGNGDDENPFAALPFGQPNTWNATLRLTQPLNVMTLMVLGITVGILVTNTIVVLESIYRHLDAGSSPAEAAANGTAEVGLAVAASTLTNLVVFTPIAFIGGIIGQFFYAFGLTVVFATLFSIIPVIYTKLDKVASWGAGRVSGSAAGEAGPGEV
ncbi:MAG: efflux RND transporter permease subunit [Acidobacteria bacterium]|nr:efflux RND transporter permease subunit [Acidobacteriota bacterium]MBA3885157.1 efflux RND transporter permease subunit [Acidobacteriota bacterium]